MKMRLFTVLMMVGVFSVASCGGGDGNGGTPLPTPTAVKLIKTDGTEVDVDARPIPLGSKIEVVFAEAVLEAEVRTSIESVLSLVGPGEAAVDGAWDWNDAYTEIVFTPARRLDYRTEYTLQIDVDASASSSATKAIADGSVPFTTMVRGDINGDGYADLLIGALGWDGTDPDVGAAYVFNGSSAGIPTAYATRLEGSTTQDFFGQVWDAADINGDGYEDVVIGARGLNAANGAAYVYLGSADGVSTTPATTLTGSGTEEMGRSVANAGDVNGDGFDDIVVGADLHTDGANTAAGAMYVYHGSAGGISGTPATTAFGSATDAWLGYFVSSMGDVNGDGYDDICASGNPEYLNGYVNLYYGSASGIPAAADAVIEGENVDDAFGLPCRNAGDVNGDGYDDLFVGAVSNNSNTGAAYLYHGSAAGIPAAYTRKIVGQAVDNYFGIGAGTGDVNGDGYDDIVIGAIGFDSNKGRADAYYGSATGVAETPSKTFNSSLNQFFGLVLPGRDYNGDGFDDAGVGAPVYDGATFQGAAYIYYGSGDGLGDTPGRVDGEQPQDYLSLYIDL